MAKKSSPPTSRDTLRSFRDRVVRLEEEKKALADDIKDVYAEAKSAGFDVKALRKVVKDTMMDQSQRAAQRETESLVDVYRASLGMLDGTPLGDAARWRFEEEAKPPAAPPPPTAPTASTHAQPPEEGAEEAPDAAPEENIEDARRAGAAAFVDGVKITENPYRAADPKRAAWDEGWCEEAGSDGMDLPPAWRRAEPKKPAGGADARPS